MTFFIPFGLRPFFILLKINEKDEPPLTDYNFNPPRGVSFMTTVPSTSGRLHSEFIRILFLRAHRETDRFFEPSGVMSSQIRSWIFPLPPRGFFFYVEI